MYIVRDERTKVSKYENKKKISLVRIILYMTTSLSRLFMRYEHSLFFFTKYFYLHQYDKDLY